MIDVGRARLLFGVALFGALVLFAIEFPFAELVHQRSQLHTLSAQLQAMQQRNASVAADIASLKKPATIEAIAHQDYGLVQPGQRSYVVLPAPNSTRGSAALAQASVPVESLVAAPPVQQSNETIASPPSPSLVSRFLDRLEFWR